MRKWTPEQREAQRRKLRAFHARKRNGGGAPVNGSNGDRTYPHGSHVSISRPGRAAQSVDMTLADLPRLIEAHELCERIGWDLVKRLAARVVG